MSREGKCSDTSYSIASFPLHRSTYRWLDAQTPHLHDPELERRPCCGCCIAGQYVISVADIPFYLFPIRYIRYLLTTSCEVWSALSHCANVRGLADKFAVLSFTHCRCVEFVNLIWQNILLYRRRRPRKKRKRKLRLVMHGIIILRTGCEFRLLLLPAAGEWLKFVYERTTLA